MGGLARGSVARHHPLPGPSEPAARPADAPAHGHRRCREQVRLGIRGRHRPGAGRGRRGTVGRLPRARGLADPRPGGPRSRARGARAAVRQVPRRRRARPRRRTRGPRLRPRQPRGDGAAVGGHPRSEARAGTRTGARRDRRDARHTRAAREGGCPAPRDRRRRHGRPVATRPLRRTSPGATPGSGPSRRRCGRTRPPPTSTVRCARTATGWGRTSTWATSLPAT